MKMTNYDMIFFFVVSVHNHILKYPIYVSIYPYVHVVYKIFRTIFIVESIVLLFSNSFLFQKT